MGPHLHSFHLDGIKHFLNYNFTTQTIDTASKKDFFLDVMLLKSSVAYCCFAKPGRPRGDVEEDIQYSELVKWPEFSLHYIF